MERAVRGISAVPRQVLHACLGVAGRTQPAILLIDVCLRDGRPHTPEVVRPVARPVAQDHIILLRKNPL